MSTEGWFFWMPITAQIKSSSLVSPMADYLLALAAHQAKPLRNALGYGYTGGVNESLDRKASMPTIDHLSRIANSIHRVFVAKFTKEVFTV
jgi:hypothetical protein